MGVLCIIACLVVGCMNKNVNSASTFRWPIEIPKNIRYESSTKHLTTGLLNGSRYIHDVMLDINTVKLQDKLCPPIENSEVLTQTELISHLAAPCRYDLLERPNVMENGKLINSPVNVFVRVYIYLFKSMGTSDFQFKVHGLLRIRYNDSRLKFGEYEPKRTEPIVGESSLRDLIWVPHISLPNEKNYNVLGTNDRDIFTSIAPSGTVILSAHVESTLYCSIKLQKFPFDELFCPIVIESWIYNSSQLLLHWEQNNPVILDKKIHLTEYALQNIWTNETNINEDLNKFHYGAFKGNFSSLSFTVHLTREVGYYTMNYFLPSIMIVAISWVTFWLQPDQTPARTTLGCSTLLSFITLTLSQNDNLSKVSYKKISKVWFLVCTCFIFGSLVEFAFVNTIWRRKHNLDLKKVNSKCILKSTLTPNMKRQRIMNDYNNGNNFSLTKQCERYQSVVESPIIIAVDEETTNKLKSTRSVTSQSQNVIQHESRNNNEFFSSRSWASMTPHEVSLWIDRKARFLFPLVFIIFNALFWTFVYCW